MNLKILGGFLSLMFLSFIYREEYLSEDNSYVLLHTNRKCNFHDYKCLRQSVNQITHTYVRTLNPIEHQFDQLRHLTFISSITIPSHTISNDQTDSCSMMT